MSNDCEWEPVYVVDTDCHASSIGDAAARAHRVDKPSVLAWLVAALWSVLVERTVWLLLRDRLEPLERSAVHVDTALNVLIDRATVRIGDNSTIAVARLQFCPFLMSLRCSQIVIYCTRDTIESEPCDIVGAPTLLSPETDCSANQNENAEPWMREKTSSADVGATQAIDNIAALVHVAVKQCAFSADSCTIFLNRQLRVTATGITVAADQEKCDESTIIACQSCTLHADTHVVLSTVDVALCCSARDLFLNCPREVKVCVSEAAGSWSALCEYWRATAADAQSNNTRRPATSAVPLSVSVGGVNFQLYAGESQTVLRATQLACARLRNWTFAECAVSHEAYEGAPRLSIDIQGLAAPHTALAVYEAQVHLKAAILCRASILAGDDRQLIVLQSVDVRTDAIQVQQIAALAKCGSLARLASWLPATTDASAVLQVIIAHATWNVAVCNSDASALVLQVNGASIRYTANQVDVRVEQLRVIDKVARSHFATLLAFDATSIAETSAADVDNASRPYVFALRMRNCDTESRAIYDAQVYTAPTIRINVHHRTLQYLNTIYDAIFASETGDVACCDVQPPHHTSLSSVLFKSFALASCTLIVNYKPSSVAKQFSRLVRSGDFVYGIAAVPLENARVHLRAVELATGCAPIDVHELALRLSAAYFPEWQSATAAYLRGVQPLVVALRLGDAVIDLVRLPASAALRGESVLDVASDSVQHVVVELLSLSARLTATTCKAIGSVDGRKCGGLCSEQPGDMAEGKRQAWEMLRDGCAGALFAVTTDPARAYTHGGSAKAARTLLRGVPRLVTRPAAGLSGAVNRLAHAAKNALDTEQKRHADRTWRK